MCLLLALAVAAIPAATPAIASDDGAAPVEAAGAPVSSSEAVPRTWAGA
jgi:hypothetical protein